MPRVEKAPLTQPQSPQFATEARVGARSRQATPELEEEEPHTFKAQPFNAVRHSASMIYPSSIFTGSKSVICKFQFDSCLQAMFTQPPVLNRPSPKKSTIPMSPNFASKSLPPRRSMTPASPEAPHTFKARPIPAAVLHGPAASSLPTPRAASVDRVKPEPFALATERRGAEYQAHLREKLAREAEQARQAAQFRAQPIHNNPDLVCASMRSLLDDSHIEMRQAC